MRTSSSDHDTALNYDEIAPWQKFCPTPPVARDTSLQCEGVPNVELTTGVRSTPSAVAAGSCWRAGSAGGL